jgi:hypothetical protein
MKTSSRKNILQRTPTRAPLRAFGACLLTLLALGTLQTLMADTVISAPASKKSESNPPPRATPLCLGQSIVQVDFSKANFDPKLAAKTAAPCLLMGMINGRLVAADVDQVKDSPTFDKLFFVTVVDDKHASFSGLLEDCIAFDGGTVGHHLADYVNKDVAFSNKPLNNRRGQLLQWVIPPADPKKPEDAKRLVLMTNGYQKGGIDIYSLVPDPVKAGNAQVTGKVKLVFKTKKLLGNFENLKCSDLFVNALDCIDLNTFKTDKNETQYPKALMVWCKPDGCKGYDNIQLSAPKYLLSCSLDDDGSSEIKVNGKEEFELKCYERQASELNTWENVVGGFVVAPTKDGKLRYWYAKSKGKYDIYGWQSSWYAYDCDLVAKSMGIKYDQAKNAVVVGSPYSEESVYHRHQYMENADDYLVETMTREYNVEQAGPGFVFDNDADKTVRLNVRAIPECENKTSGDDKVGVTENAEDKDIDSLNREVTINGGKVEMDDSKARLVRLRRTQGTNVVRIILGWPYVAMPGNADPAKADCPSIVITKSNTTVDQNSFNNGLSWSLEYGAQGGEKRLWSFGAGVKAGYEYKYDHMKNNSFMISESGTYKAVVNAKDLEAAKTAYASGAVFTTKVVPQFTRISKVVPSKENPTLHIDGGPGEFLCYAVGMQLAPASENVTMFAFLGKDPSITGAEPTTYQDYEDGKRKSPLAKFQTNYAALSDGLLQRPFGSLIVYKDNMDKELNEQLDMIRAWQKSNPLVDDLQGFCDGGGVAPYGRTEGKSPGCYVSNFNKATTLSISTGSTDIVTSTHQGYVGAYFEWTAGTPLGGLKSKGDCLYKGGKSEMHSKSATDAFAIFQPGHSNSSNERWYYFYNIDVPALKSYMLSHSYKLRCNSAGDVKGQFENEAVRPTFVPKFCWDADQPFVLGFPWIPPGYESRKKKTASNN